MKLTQQTRMNQMLSLSTPLVYDLLLWTMHNQLLLQGIMCKTWLGKLWSHLLNANAKKMNNLGSPCRMLSQLNSLTLVFSFYKTFNKLRHPCLELLLHLHSYPYQHLNHLNLYHKPLPQHLHSISTTTTSSGLTMMSTTMPLFKPIIFASDKRGRRRNFDCKELSSYK